MNSPTGPDSDLVLVEPGAHRPGGHQHRTLIALARAHGGALVVTPRGVTPETAESLTSSGARVMTPVGVLPRLLVAGARLAEVVAGAGRMVLSSRRWPLPLRRAPHQITLVARCLDEAACIRAARRAGTSRSTVVLLSASEALHGAAGILGGRHIRLVHEVSTTEDLLLRLVGRLARFGERRVLVLATTNLVREDLVTCFPQLKVQVRPYAVADPGDRLTHTERSHARKRFAIPDGDRAVCLVGGWWPYKDIAGVDAALTSLSASSGPRLHLLVAGAPLEESMLARWARLPSIRLIVISGRASEGEVRAVYAAADACLVARNLGVGKESGLVTDAVRLGVALVVSTHDRALTRRLAEHDWVRFFAAGDPASLSAVLRELTEKALPCPAPDAVASLGVPTAADQVAFLTSSQPGTEQKGPR